jgi:hypothetical protein
MKVKVFGLAAVAAMAFTAFAASSASATTLEVGGVTKNSAVSISASLASGTKTVLARTDGTLVNECSQSSLAGSTGSPFTGSTLTAVTSNLQFLICTRLFTVHKAGVVHLQFIDATRATVSFSQTEWTVSSPFGTLTCVTGSGVDVGTLTGVASGSATMDINAVINCGFLVPSATLKGTYTVTSPSGLGVSA